MRNDLVPKQGTPEYWKLRNMYYVTGSEMASAIGISPYLSRAKLYDMKKRKLETPDEINNQSDHSEFAINMMNWGKDNESVALELFRTYMDPIYSLEETSLWEIEAPYYAATPDGLIRDKRTDELVGCVEVKCPWKKKIYAEVLAGTVPLYHYTQMIAQMVATGLDRCFYTVWTPTEFAVIEVPFNPKAWEWMLNYLSEFVEYLKNNIRPPNSPAKFRKIQLARFLKEPQYECRLVLKRAVLGQI